MVRELKGKRRPAPREEREYTLLAAPGFGFDVCSVVEDTLDRDCLSAVERLQGIKAGAAPVVALDIGGGHGAMSVKMAERGALVTLCDPIEQPLHLLEAPKAVRQRIHHARKPLGALECSDVRGCGEGHRVDIIYSQRMLHYLTYDELKSALTKCREQYAARNCKLFLSVTGVESALGDEHPGNPYPLGDTRRHAMLEGPVSLNDQILHPVTFYRPEEFKALLEACGFKNVQISVSERGTIKAEAENGRAIGRSAGDISRCG